MNACRTASDWATVRICTSYVLVYVGQSLVVAASRKYPLFKTVAALTDQPDTSTAQPTYATVVAFIRIPL